MDMNTTNTLLIILVVLLVAFGVWYFASQPQAAPQEEGIQVNIGGGDENAPN